MRSLNEFLDAAPRRASFPTVLRDNRRHNSYGGVDLYHYGYGFIRVAPKDGEWDAGVEVYAFDDHDVVIGGAELDGAAAEPRIVWDLVELLYRELR